MQEKNCRTKQFIASPQLALTRTAPLEQQGFASLHRERCSMLKNRMSTRTKRALREIVPKRPIAVCLQKS